jgi:GalNAc-alpha-(1->4)-GalNAc-alpha-(1->3)-diNAcBac-PP-undecaprenol alpha-1,4-N-acetyl-D-galactosaminyltransferase
VNAPEVDVARSPRVAWTASRSADRGRDRGARVALVISSLGGGGAERISSALANRWARAGRGVGVVTIASRDADVHSLDARVERVALDLLRPSRSLAEGLLQGGARVHALRRALERLRPDVVVSFMGRTNVLSLLATAGTGRPVLACERTDPREERARPPWPALRRMLYPRAAGVVVQTESVAAWARPLSRRVHVIPNFVERPPAMATPGTERGPWRLLAMGRLGPEKGFDLLVEAFARVARAHPGWSLTILGEGPERPRLEARVRASGLERRVSMPGFVRDPNRELAAAHAFALSSRREGFPNALLEAMACGLPVAAFDCPSGPAEIVVHERTGLLVRAGDVAQLAAALGRLMGSPACRAALGEAAREIAVVLSPDRILERWSALVDGVGEGR